MNYRKLRKNIKAISPIISVLLMIAIAVVASLVVYAWVMGYIGYQTGKTGDSVVIQSVNWNPEANPPAGSYPLSIYLQNIGTTTIAYNPAPQLYINGVLVPIAAQTAGLSPGNTWTIVPTTAPTVPYTQGSTLTIKVTTSGGTYSQVTQTAP